jgi:putative endonuclease
MTRARLDTGRRGEDIAAARLSERGYHIVELNFRCPLGEMDIVARQGEVLVFVEVRTRRSDRFGRPLESVGPAKQRKLSQVALYYI